MGKTLSIAEGLPRDPDHWAYLEEMPDGKSNDPEANREVRILMASVAMLHQDYPNQHCFSDEEVTNHRPEVLKRYPALRSFQ